MPPLLLTIALSIAALSQSAPATDYSKLGVLGEDWAASARADKLNAMEVSMVLELAQTWEASNRENKFDPYIRKLAGLHAQTAQDIPTLRPVLHGAACWHARKTVAAKGAAAAPPAFLWNWINPKNPARCPA